MCIMQDVHLPALDLNLLVALHALLRERHVTRAAKRVGLSQPAMSHALARLRAAFGDPLLVRTARGMQPTPRAEAMAVPLERALGELQRAVQPPAAFDASQSTRRFVVATDDYCQLVLLPKLIARLWREAPAIEVQVTPVAGRVTDELAAGRVDAAIGVVGVLGPLGGVYAQRLFRERFVCVVRADHPSVGKRMSVEQFVSLPHALVAPTGERGGIVDDALLKLGKKRHVAISVPHFLVAPHLVRHTDLVLTLGERVAKAAGHGLRLLPHPLELAPFTVSLLWHARNHADAAHVWFRHVIAGVSKTI